MVIKMSARMHELINIVRTYEKNHWRRHTNSPGIYLDEPIYEDVPQEVIDAYEEMLIEKLSS